MAIEVLIQGVNPETLPYKGKCRYCHSYLKWLAQDAVSAITDRDGHFTQVKCPTCGHRVSGYQTK